MALVDGDNAVPLTRFDYAQQNRLKNNWVQSDPVSNLSNPQQGMIVHDSDDDKIYSRASASYNQIYTVGNPPPGRLPEGSIIAWIGGYFQDGSNGTYTRVLGSDNTVAAVNTLLNATGFYVCDGAALNLATSTIFNGASRFLPHLTDDRFLMGDTTIGGIGGSSTMAHTHVVGTYAVQNHLHTVDPTNTTSTTPTGPFASSTAGAGVATSSHTHDIDIAEFNSGSTQPTLSGSSGAASNDENRPVYLSVFYLMFVLA